MAYTPINWQTGDTITAAGLNKMDNGWSVGPSAQTLFNDSVTTESSEYGNEAEVSMTQITADTITVTFGGQDYTCAKIEMDGSLGYGGVDSGWNYDFTEYPFAIVSSSESTYFATETAGTFSFKIDATAMVVETSPTFDMAANKAVTPILKMVQGQTSWQDVHDAIIAGKPVLWYENGGSDGELMCCYVSYIGISSHGDYEIRAVVWDGTAVTTKILQTSSADGVFSW